MGDRGNIVVQVKPGEHGRIFLYSHWRGSAIPGLLQEALLKKWRWGDPAYLTRIIFDVMTHNDHGAETGFGIDVNFPDNEHDVLVVDPREQKVFLYRYQWEGPEVDWNHPIHGWTFDEFIAIDEPTWEGLERAIPEHLRVLEDL
jgi:hypothetical protein